MNAGTHAEQVTTSSFRTEVGARFTGCKLAKEFGVREDSRISCGWCINISSNNKRTIEKERRKGEKEKEDRRKRTIKNRKEKKIWCNRFHGRISSEVSYTHVRPTSVVIIIVSLFIY